LETLERKIEKNLGVIRSLSQKTLGKKESDEKNAEFSQVSHLMTKLLLFKLGTVYSSQLMWS
jgi:hypothetical protein